MANKKKKSFVESQPEGPLKDTFFKYIPDAFQMSNYLKQFLSDGKKKKRVVLQAKPRAAQFVR